MRKLSVLLGIAVAAATATTVWGHPQTAIDLTLPPNEAGIDGFYYWYVDGAQTIWEETNGKTNDGMFADRSGAENPRGRTVLGLQIHHLCAEKHVRKNRLTADPSCLYLEGSEGPRKR